MRVSSFADGLRRAAKILRRDGSGRLAMIVLRLLASPFMDFGRLVFFVRALDNTWTAPALPAGFELGLASASDCPGLVAGGRPDPRLPELCHERFERGDRCAVIRSADGEVMHSRWATTIATSIPELGRMIVPRQDEVYFYDAYTRPDQRERGLDGAARCFVFEVARAAGLARAYTYVRSENGPGLRAAHRWLTCIGELSFFRIRGCRAWVIRRRNAGPSSGGGRVESLEDRADPWPDLR